MNILCTIAYRGTAYHGFQVQKNGLTVCEVFQDALEAVADTALARNIGARGLRAVMEGLLTKVMYDVPSDPTITDVTITKACVDGEAEPTVLHDPEKVAQRAKFKTGTADKPAAPAS